MRLLVLGGTAMLGRAVAAEAVARGHDVTCLARGVSGDAPDGVRWVRGDRDLADGLAAVTGPEDQWDAVVDVSRQPGQVRRAMAALEPLARHLVFVSTGNVYAVHAGLATDESVPLLPPLEGEVMEDMSTYGEAKVACEAAVLEAFGTDRALIARAGLIGGPGDASGRSGWWPWRFAHPAGGPDGPVLVPDDPELPMSIIDVRDLAAWLVRCTEARTAGVFDAVGQPDTLGGLISAAREVAGHDGPVVAASPAWLLEQGVQEWMGEDSLPLWIADPEWRGFGAHTGAAARAAGLTTRPVTETFRDAAAYEEAREATDPRRCGLTDDTERRLLDLLGS
ncbi:NAD-dependent epimerase/dehydratase family protein [Knoellia subterranea]|uniref:Epimerase n=1 Tax=Knoellia subterranea KCTC 19937 TaxID=1385521 RepID=A0A0A0JIB2_9MICO|nr:NAD-dependent epimerase/dehydratase family protein [Knoellia subterranea]KGN36484.1 epimerase [Knoellia subterranea KCTC 19937]